MTMEEYNYLHGMDKFWKTGYQIYLKIFNEYHDIIIHSVMDTDKYIFTLNFVKEYALRLSVNSCLSFHQSTSPQKEETCSPKFSK